MLKQWIALAQTAHIWDEMELTEVSDLMKDVEFKVFAGPANDDDSKSHVLF